MAANNSGPRRQVYHSPAAGHPAARAPARPQARPAASGGSGDRRIPSQRAAARGGGWYEVPPQQPVQQRPSRRAQSDARRLREKHRRQKRLRFGLAVGGILLASGIITLLLPPQATRPAGEDAPAAVDPGPANEQLVAPLPYGGQQAQVTAPAVDWGTVGPQRQEETYTFTAAPTAPDALPACGAVTNQWFADAAFLGDSLTVGYIDYDIEVAGALICAYTGASPNQVVNRAVLTHSERGDEVPLDVLAAAQPKKLYVLMGTNALRFGDNNEGFLAYYGRMLDELRTALPDTMIFVQSVLPVRPEALADSPGLASDTLRTVNAALAALCREKGCYFLDLNAEFSDETGALQADYAQPDGIHLTPSGYRKWVAYLTTHTPYDLRNPYQPGSEWYLSPDLLALLSDLP